jgi:hypothetical protein
MAGGLATYRVTLDADGTKSLSVRGDFIFIKSSSFAVQVELAQNQTSGRSGESYKNSMRQGEKWFTAQEFDQIRFLNLQSTSMTVEVVAGFGEYAREVPERISTADENITTAVNIAGVSTPETLIAERTFRKRVTVQARLANTSNVYVAESAAKLAAGASIELAPGSGITFESKTALWCMSATIGDDVIATEEIWND